MKHHIFMLAMMLQAIAIHAQNEQNIQQLMDYLEQHHPEEISYSLGRTNERIYEERSWKKGYDIRKDRPIVRYQLQLLKDTVMQHFAAERCALFKEMHRRRNPLCSGAGEIFRRKTSLHLRQLS